MLWIDHIPAPSQHPAVPIKAVPAPLDPNFSPVILAKRQRPGRFQTMLSCADGACHSDHSVVGMLMY